MGSCDVLCDGVLTLFLPLTFVHRGVSLLPHPIHILCYLLDLRLKNVVDYLGPGDIEGSWSMYDRLALWSVSSIMIRYGNTLTRRLRDELDHVQEEMFYVASTFGSLTLKHVPLLYMFQHITM